MKLILHLGTQGDLVAEPREDRLHLAQDQRQGMQVTAAHRVGHERQVDPLGVAQGGVAFRLQATHPLGNPLENVFFKSIRFSPGRGPFGWRQGSELPQDGGQLALLAEQAHPQVF